MKPEEANKLYLQYLRLEGLEFLTKIYDELGDSLPTFVESYKKMQQRGIRVDRVISVVQNLQQIPQIEKQYKELCENVQNLYQLKFTVTGEVNRLRNQIIPLQNYFYSLNYQCRR